ncbi:MAG: hydrogenase nickel incorporation protein HypB [Planctomycetaceae bacterium]|nr:hydrogenase nickel incorporation protein HypB [Planctomycetaceae bacterium]
MSVVTISVNRDLQSDAKQRAAELRAEWSGRGLFVVNLVSSPGAGKTSLLQAMAQHWAGRRSMAVLVGDLATDRDAERLRPFVPVEQLTTGGACHLELPLIERGLTRLPTDGTEFLFIENIGNLVCPASHDLGEHLRAVVLSTTEGDDKPGKYPKMFRSAAAMVISKSDLLPYVPFSVDDAVTDARRIRPDLPVFPTCALSGAGVEDWCRFLEQQREGMLRGVAAADVK